MSRNDNSTNFWMDAISLQGAATPRVMPRVLVFTAFSAAVWFVSSMAGYRFVSAVAFYEVAGAVLGLLLILRTNAGYDRWWEARKLWGGIVNQSRNLALAALAYGPRSRQWRVDVVSLTAAFAHVVRRSLRGERQLPEVERLLGPEQARAIAAAEHMPSRVSYLIGQRLREATEAGTLDSFAFLQIDRERSTLIDHMGACERILKTPLPLAYSIKIRRFILLFLLTLPFALLDRVGALVPLVVLSVAYPLLSLDQIGYDLQNPFSTRRLSHLPLDQICETIEGNLLALLEADEPGGPTTPCRPVDPDAVEMPAS